MFEKILIANRGEIACRVIKTAHAMGIATVAVYSDADVNARHVALADEAFRLGPAPAKDSYLLAEMIIEVAKRSGAQAIHPGYGFLSENAQFAQLCSENNIAFIGPPVSAIEAMGSKSAAKKIMEEAGVPLVQGYHGENQETEWLQQQADSIGYPVLIKATAGGGGKGMRIVESSDEFVDALASCQREAKASFGDDKVLVEKYLRKPRHVEIQVFCDSQGNGVYLFERDCSVQRRYQKIIEEAPAPGLDESIRSKMGEVAVTAAKAIDYEGAGTVEFLYDHDGSFYFMEMNTRLQVEHPVTEFITGQDLVEWQLRVASGESLPLTQSQLSFDGHAFEVRIYAEDPDNQFLPSTGKLDFLATPQENRHVRIDTGIRQGDEVSVYYDPLIAKLIVWDRDRNAALARLRGALNEYRVVGLTTNINFLKQLAGHDGFIGLDLDTGFIERYYDELFATKPLPSDEIYVLASLYTILKQDRNHQSADTADPYSPWDDMSGWRLNEDNHHRVTLIDEAANETEVVLHFRDRGFLVELNQREYQVLGELAEQQLSVNLGGEKFSATVVEQQHQLTLFAKGERYTINVKQQGQEETDNDAGSQLSAPMPGTVISVMVEQGDHVETGQALLVMEAMKMEHTIKAPSDGVIGEIMFQPGDLVDEGAELVVFEAE